MSFNSHTYYANKYARQAWEELAAARVHRDLGNLDRAKTCINLARCYMRLSRSNRNLRQMERAHGW